MKADLDDHPRFNQPKKPKWAPYIATVLSAATLMGFAYLHNMGWGVTVDINKLADSVTVNGKPPEPSVILPPHIISNEPPTQRKQKTISRSESRFIRPSGMPPLSYELKRKVFQTIFIQHPSCAPNDMKWTQMDCSNFKARAMKRFGDEWGKNSYWDGENIIKNKTADYRVNSELNM